MGKNTALNLVQSLDTPELLQPNKNGSNYENDFSPIPATPPAYMKMTAEKIKIWKQIVSISPEGILHESDLLLVEQAVYLIHQFRLQKMGGHEAWGTAKTKQLVAILNDLGLSPKGRSQL